MSTLTVSRGELVFLIGANGAGKSTCARAVLGLIATDEGVVERSPSIEVGYVPQRLALTATLPLTLRRLMTLTGRFAARDIDAALHAVGLERLGDPPVTTLSGGEFQRLLLARALIHRPDLLVLGRAGAGGRYRGRRCGARTDRKHPRRPRLRGVADLARSGAGDGDRRRHGGPPCRMSMTSGAEPCWTTS